ncbi:MAG: family 16 glycoside hydrolase [Armatimonadota bacterium]
MAAMILSLCGALAGAPAEVPTITCSGEELPARLIFGDTFRTLEGWEDLTPQTEWYVEDGRLIGRWGPGGSTIWSDREFAGDLYVRFRARLLEPEDDWRTDERPDGGKNLNFRFLVSGPDGADIRHVYRDLAEEATGPNRIGDDQYEGYFFTWTWRHTRLRRSPGYDNVSERTDILPEIGVDYTIEVLKQGPRLRYLVDGELLHDFTDPSPHTRGRIGFTLWHSTIAVDFIEVYQLHDD